ncbi:hypothetical protein CYG49_04815 [Candidatus Saccharibacteria bacterium]|nr:MAG: hypothetical protein CYG49_04815 [Candidatus Saccharibacteria bacterium]
MQSIFYVRHGQSQANFDRIVAGQSDSPLTTIGEEQARSAGEWAKAQGLSFDVIISSDLQRAKRTAQIIAEKVGFPEESIRYNVDLRERYCGKFEGKPTDDYFQTPESVSIKEYGVESLDALHERATRVLNTIIDSYPDKTILIVAHSGIGKMLRLVNDGRDASELDKTISIPNATILRLV